MLGFINVLSTVTFPKCHLWWISTINARFLPFSQSRKILLLFLSVKVACSILSFLRTTLIQTASKIWIQSTTELWSNRSFEGPLLSSLKTALLEYHSLICYASFDTIGAKTGRLFNQQLVFEFSSKIDFWPILLQNSSKSHFLKKCNLGLLIS